MATSPPMGMTSWSAVTRRSTPGPVSADYLFVERLQVSSSGVAAKVLVSSSATPNGEGNGSGSTGPRGVAVNSTGMVLTTLPIAPSGVLTLNYDVPVAFGIDFPKGVAPNRFSRSTRSCKSQAGA